MTARLSIITRLPAVAVFWRLMVVVWFLFGLFVFFDPNIAAANELKKVALGTTDDYTRLVFTFQDQVNDVVVRRDDVDTVYLDFGEVGDGGVSTGPTDGLITEVTVQMHGPRLSARVLLSTNRFEVRHFLSRDRFSCVLDFKNLATDASTLQPLDNYDQLEKKQIEPLSFNEVVRGLSLFVVDSSGHDPGADLVSKAIIDLSSGRLDEGIEKLNAFKTNYPDHPYADPAWFLLGDAYFAKGLPENFQAATDNWRMALDSFPDSFTAPRAAFMIGEANRLMDFRTDAAGFFKLCAERYPNNHYGSLAILRAADMDLLIGHNQEAKQTLAPLLALGNSSLFGRLALARSGMADYQDTLYSQACETFREVLDIDPAIFQLYPNMLYAIGDSYSYLNRPDLTVLFLEHALNLMPDHPKADVMLARIGNALQSMNRPNDAISFFNIAKDRFPDRDGGLVSQIRLADMGALRAFFSPEQVFDALDRGARQATVRMYDKIIGQASESPLLQLAYLKIGQAQAADGENGEAIRWLRDLVLKYPKGVLMDEAKPILSRAVVNEAQKRYELGQYDQVDRLNSENFSFLEGPDQVRFQRLLAESYQNQGRVEDALNVWKQIEANSPEKRLADQMELVEAALRADKPLEAFSQLKSTFKEFPEASDWVEQKIADVGRILANQSIYGTVDDLLNFRNDPIVTPLTEISQLALSDAITTLVNQKKYQQASDLMDTYRSEYPDDELSPEYLLTQAKIDRRLGNMYKSWDRLADFRNQYPEDARVAQTILDTINDARKSGMFDDAYRYEELFRQIYPNNILGRNMVLNRADELYANGRLQDSLNALAFFQRQYPSDPATPATYIDQYRKLLLEDRLDLASQTLEKLRALYPQDPLTMESYVIQYRDFIKKNRPDEAFNLLSRFRQTFPQDYRQPDLLLEEARDKFAIGRSSDGLANWNDFLNRYPQDERIPELTLLTARREIKENLVEPAVELYRRYIQNYPDRPDRAEVILELAAIETSSNMLTAAYNDLEAFRRQYPGHAEEPQVLLDEIALATNLRRIDDASLLYDTFRTTYPNHPDFAQSFLDQTRMEMTAGRTGQALATLESGIVQNPGLDNTKDVQDMLLNLYLDEGRIEDWAGAMEEFLGRDPNPQQNLADRYAKYSQVGQVYQELGRQNDAQRNFDLALANRPPDASGESLYTIAGAYRRMGLQTQLRNVLEIMQGLPDPIWKNVANQELSNLG